MGSSDTVQSYDYKRTDRPGFLIGVPFRKAWPRGHELRAGLVQAGHGRLCDREGAALVLLGDDLENKWVVTSDLQTNRFVRV